MKCKNINSSGCSCIFLKDRDEGNSFSYYGYYCGLPIHRAHKFGDSVFDWTECDCVEERNQHLLNQLNVS